MKRSIPALALIFAALSTKALADTPPQLKEGLWEMTVTTSQGGTHTMKQCLDQATGASLLDMGSDVTKSMKEACSKNEFKKTSTGFETLAECKMASSVVTSKGVFNGDFSSSYTGAVESTFAPPLFGQTHSTVKLAGRHLGACGADMKPGDMVMDNGMRMNMNDAAKQAKQAAEMFKNSGAEELGQMVDQKALAKAMKQAQGQLDPKSMEAMRKAMEQMGQMGE